MKVSSGFISVVVSSSAAIIVAAGSTFLILGYQWQIVNAFNMDTVRRVPSKSKPCHSPQVRSASLIDAGHIKASVASVRFATTRHNTLLFMSEQSDDEKTKSISPTTTVNFPLVTQNLANQALVGFQIWTGGRGFTVLSEETHIGIGALILGIVGVIPMLALSRAIETSESPIVLGLNLSTNMAVLRLFGSTSQPVVAFLVSLLMATSTGIVEETVFRGQCKFFLLRPILYSFSSSGLGLTNVFLCSALPAFAVSAGNGDVLTGAVLSTLLFAVLHTNPIAFFKGKDAFIDNFALLILQIINGGTFALLYLLTGNLAVPIITHTLYDLYIFYKTHIVDVAGQMEYAEEEALMPICSSNSIENKWVGQYGEDWFKKARESFYLMDTNRDGELSRKELRVALYSYGIDLSKVESEEVKEVADTDGSGSIDFDEYLEFIGPTGSTFKAVRNTLLGPT